MMMVVVSSAPAFSRVLFTVCLLFAILSSALGFSSTPISQNVLLPSKDKTVLFLRYGPPPSFAASCRHHQPALLFASSSKTDNNNDSGAGGDNDNSITSFSSSSSPLDRPWQAAVDAAALMTFAAVGIASHNNNNNNNANNDFDFLAVATTTAAPFVLAWFTTSPFTNVYNKTEKTSLQEAFLQVVPAWAIAMPLGCILRGIIKGYVPPLAFVLVTLIATLVLLGLGRVLYNVIEDVFVELV